MSFWGPCTANSSSASTYVSKLELTLSRQGTVRSPPPAFESAANTAFGMVASSVSPEGSLPFSAESSPRNSTSPLAGTFPAAHLSTLDTTLVHGNRGRSAVKDGHCMHPSSATPFQVPWRYPSSCWDPQRDEACIEHQNCAPNLGSANHGKQWSANHPRTSRSSAAEGDPSKRNIFIPSAASTKEPPCWTSRLDVVLDTSRASSPHPVSRFHTAFAPCGPPPPPLVCSRCMAHMSDLQSSVKWHMSTCSMAVKPFPADTQGHNHAHSVLLVPKRWKMSSSSRSYTSSTQAPQQVFQPPETPSLQITRFQVTSSTENPTPVQQTSTKEIWLSPAVLSTGGGSQGNVDAFSADPDPNLFIFHNRHPGGAGIRNSPCPAYMPTHHKASEVSMFLATPLTPVPFQVVRECKRSPNPTILIQAHNASTNGPSLQAGDGPTVSLTICPAGCPEVPSAQQHLGSRSSQGAQTLDNTRIPFGNSQTPTMNYPHCAGTGGPSVVVSIAALESGRRVVKISVSSSRNRPQWSNNIPEGYRNITLGN